MNVHLGSMIVIQMPSVKIWRAAILVHVTKVTLEMGNIVMVRHILTYMYSVVKYSLFYIQLIVNLVMIIIWLKIIAENLYMHC